MKEGTVLGAEDVGHLPNMKLCPIPQPHYARLNKNLSKFIKDFTLTISSLNDLGVKYVQRNFFSTTGMGSCTSIMFVGKDRKKECACIVDIDVIL